jgi:hypothetical protein
MSDAYPRQYLDWIGHVIQKPFEAGWQGGGLVATTCAALIAAFALFSQDFFAMLPAGHYPRIVLALPFLGVALVAFFALSPVFYQLYLRSFREE